MKSGSGAMGLEEYANVFVDIDKHGFLTEEDRNYLTKKGILKSKKVNPLVCCPRCNTPLPEEAIRKIMDLLVNEISSNRENFAKSLSESNGKPIDKPESMMYR